MLPLLLTFSASLRANNSTFTCILKQITFYCQCMALCLNGVITDSLKWTQDDWIWGPRLIPIIYRISYYASVFTKSWCHKQLGEEHFCNFYKTAVRANTHYTSARYSMIPTCTVLAGVNSMWRKSLFICWFSLGMNATDSFDELSKAM